MEGRLEVQVLDSDGRGVPARLELASRSPDFVATVRADSGGRAVLRHVPPGSYSLVVRHPGFDPAERRIEIRSEVPRAVEVVLRVAVLRSEVTVSGSAPLFEPYRPSQPARAGPEALRRSLGTTLGRSAVDVVTTMPGWLLEANAVLHPRGSEYDTQYVVDGMPLYDNRSIAFAPAFETSEFEAVTVLTAGIPAIYGRRLGGVIALDTRRADSPGHRSTAELQAGSYGTRIGSVAHQYARGGSELSVGIQGGATDRYLDPPSIENFTNRASSSGGNLRLARDTGAKGRISGYARTGRTGFLVPNDLIQQAAGQRQDRRSGESAGQVHFQAALSPGALLSIRGMVRELSSALWSDERSTPVFVLQDRGFREGALVGDVAFEGERHSLKVGADLRLHAIRERFSLADAGELDALRVDFSDRARSVETSVYAHDWFRLGRFAASFGARFDHYSLLVTDRAFSPRLAASYFVPQAEVQLFAAYDRVFQPPPSENLLLSSAATGLRLDAVEGTLPVPASRADFFEAGVRKPFGNSMRLEAKHYWRKFENAIDDDVFLNTGISFPITFASASVRGTEALLEVPRWRGVSAVLSYSHMLGLASSPVTGGLFIEGGEAEELRDIAVEFPISQDQRNTVATLFRFEFHRRVWAAAGIRYGSGLPVELEDDDSDGDAEQDGEPGSEDESPESGGFISQAILDRVNLPRRRVRPNASIDFSVGARIFEQGNRSAELQFDVRNVIDRLNVINFSGLLSDTALAPGRQATLQLRLRF